MKKEAKMRSAIVGYGVIGRLHGKILREMGYLTAICDIDAEALSEISDANTYGDYLQMLDTEKPDTVHICTPHYLHADMVIEALKRNINVVCEKPLCIKIEDIDRILAAERNSKAILGVCHQNRYNPCNAYIKEYLKDKRILGASGQVSWSRDAEYYASGAWRGRWDTEGGGVLINQALHTLDLLIWLCGMPEGLTATVDTLTLRDSIEVEDTATLLARGEVGFNFFATNGSACNLPVELTVKTEDETVKVMPRVALLGDKKVDFPKEKYVGPKACYGDGHGALFTHFYDCVEKGTHFPIDGEEGAKVIRVILAAYRSHGQMTEVL